MSAFPGPQSNWGDRPIDTAPIVALPINVSTTRRERFMAAILLPDFSQVTSVSITHDEVSKRPPVPFTASCGFSASGETDCVAERAEAAALDRMRTGVRGG